MANPVMAAITTFDTAKSSFAQGCLRSFWMRIPGLSAGSACTTTDVPMYNLLNPINSDLVVVSALAVITTAAGTTPEIDVGLGDDAAGTSNGSEIFDTLAADATGVFEGTASQAIASNAIKCIWKKSGTSTDSYLIIQQGANADASALRWNLYLKCMYYDDMIGREGEQAAVSVA